MDYDEAHKILTDMARVKMQMNSHKGRIEEIPSSEIASLMKKEVVELDSAIAGEQTIEIIEEAADVVNFAIAAVQQSLEKYRNRK